MFQYLLTAGIVVLLAREAFPATTAMESTIDTVSGTATMVVSTNELSTGTVNTAQNSVTNAATKTAATAVGKTTSKSSQTGTTTATVSSSPVTTASSTLPPFQCYKGNCSGVDCHLNGSISSTLILGTCPKNQCVMTVTSNSTWSFTEFDCNDGECICQKKVTGQWKTCCTTSRCNLKPPGCSHASNLVASLVVLAISFVSLYLQN